MAEYINVPAFSGGAFSSNAFVTPKTAGAGYGITVKTLDTAGGLQLGGGQSFWLVDDYPVILQGDPVQGHGSAPHAAPTMMQGSSWMTLDGIPVVRAGHLASCGHKATGRSWFTIPD